MEVSTFSQHHNIISESASNLVINPIANATGRERERIIYSAGVGSAMIRNWIQGFLRMNNHNQVLDICSPSWHLNRDEQDSELRIIFGNFYSTTQLLVKHFLKLHNQFFVKFVNAVFLKSIPFIYAPQLKL